MEILAGSGLLVAISFHTHVHINNISVNRQYSIIKRKSVEKRGKGALSSKRLIISSKLAPRSVSNECKRIFVNSSVIN